MLKFLRNWLCADIIEENKIMRQQLLERGNIFFMKNKGLGINKSVFGFVVDGIIVELSHEFRPTPRAADEVCLECGKVYSHYTGCTLAKELPKSHRR